MRRHWLLPLCALLGVLFTGFLPKLEAQEAQDSADLVLLIDGSENVGAANFPYVRDLALRIIERLDVGRDTIRVALALYNDSPDIKFYLNSFDSKTSVLQAVKGLAYSGGTESNLGAALEEVAESLLSQTTGGRAEEGVPQMLVVISAGQSTDDTGAGDRSLKRAGVITFGVGIGDSAPADLEAVATDPSFVLSAPEFRTVANMGDQLLPYINGVVQRTIIVQNEVMEALAVGKRDIIFLIDSTMGSTVINSIREFIKRFVSAMPIGPDEVQVGIAQFSNAPRLEMDLNSHASKESLTSALGRIRARPGQTVNIGAALDFVRTNMLRPEKGSRMRSGVPQLLLLMTSKKSSDSVQEPARSLQQMGVLTLAAGSKAADEDELKQIAFADSVVFMLRDFRVLLRNPMQITNALSTLAGGLVTEGPTETVVEITTVQTQKVVRDIVFLVDGSTYIGSSDFPHVRDFMINVVNLLDVRPDRVQIGLLQFAEVPKIEFYLNSYGTRQDVVNRITQLRPTGGSLLNTGAAMQYALTNMFQTSTGSRRRQGVQQVLVLITGGPAQDQIRTVADKLALAGVLTFTVSSGQADEAVLRTVAFVPDLAYHEGRFSNLPALADQIMPKLITVVGDTDVTTIPEETVTGVERDVAFLIDGTDNVRADFPYIRDFIIKVIEPLDIGADKVRVSVVQHSERPTPSFYLNTYQNKDEVIRAVNEMRLSGGRSLNTGSALRYMKDTILSERHGSRAARQVPQFLIVLTGSRSRDNVKDPAGALKTDGVVPFGVGVKDADPKQIQAISHNPSFAFNVREFSELSTVPQRLNNYVSLPKEQLLVVLQEGSYKRDVVFLVDGSDDSRNGLPAIREFIRRMVEELDIDEDKYSSEPQTDFSLNTYTEKQDVLDAVRGLNHRGGIPLNTGVALDYVRNNVFTDSSGSRHQEGVPQILILLSGGKSRDDVASAAAALKQDKVIPFCIDEMHNDFQAVIGFVEKTVEKLNVHEDHDRVSVVQYSREPSVEFFLNTYKTQQTVAEAVQSLGHKGGSPLNTGVALQYVKDYVFTANSGSRHQQGVPQILIVVMGGRSSDDFQSAIEHLKGMGVVVFVVGTKNADTLEIQTISQKPHLAIFEADLNDVSGIEQLIFSTTKNIETVKGAHPVSYDTNRRDVVFLLDGSTDSQRRFPDIKDFVQRIVSELNIGTNKDHVAVAQYSDTAQINFNLMSYFTEDEVLDALLSAIASHKDASSSGVGLSSSVKKDIVFLIDGSDDVRSKFSSIREFVAKVVDTLDVDQGKDKVAVIQYSNNAEQSFSLNTYNKKDDILKHIARLKPKGGRPHYIGAALQFVLEKVFVSNAGGRKLEGAKQILVILAGGRSRDSPRGPANMLKTEGVVTFAVGSRASNTAEMNLISSDPNYTYSVPDFVNLAQIQHSLVRNLAQFQVEEETKEAERQPTGRDVVFLLDGSDGTRTEFPAVRDFVQRMVDTLSVDDSRDRVAVVQYSRDAAVQFYLNTYTTKAEILDTVRGLRHKGGRPLYTGAALQYVRDNVFTASAGSRRLEGVPQVLILLSGARSVDSVDAPASALKQLGVLTFAIGTRNADKREMQKIAHEPTHAVSVSEFNDLPNVQQQLQSSVEAVIVEVTPETPTAPVDAPKKDIVFLLDGSDATRNGFPAMRDFVERVVEKLNVGENKDRVSVVQYSREPEVHFYLNTYNTRADIVDTVRGLRHRGGRTLNTGAALQYVRDNVFTNSSGSRRLQGVPQMLILLNGGRSYDNVDAPASALKQQGIVVIGIGAGRADSAEMQKISSDPTYALSVSELTDLPSVHEQLSSVMSTVLVRATPITPTVTAERQPTGRDVVFLLDGSDGTRTEFPAVRDFVQRMVDTLSVDDSRDRVAVVQYSRDAAVQFYLNTYTTKAEILDTVRGLRHKGGRPLYTGAALQYVRDNVFTASAGSRRLEGVPQVLILLSGARSVDSVDAPASALKQLGVLTFAIGTRNADKREMQKIAHEPTHAVSVFEFNDLPNVQQQLQSSVEAVIVEVTPETPTAPVDAPKKDIVFLLDGSDATRNGFPAMRDFVERVVEKLNVGENKDRVSVVQYSREPEVHFYLNTYNTRADIVDTVRGLRHRGGRTLNTGAALQYVRDNVFTNSSGSRRLQGVPQMLILLNGGRSYDNVDAPASALKQQGIVVIGIGAGRADSAEMQKISSDPTYALSVSELTDLPSVHEQLSSVMSTVLVRATPITPTVTAERQPTGRDVVFLLDGSDGTRTEFPAVRDFVQRMVDTLSVDDSRDRVAVVQYSRDAAVQFYLNTYTTKAEILDTVRGLRHKGGRPLYTGAALQYVRDNVFTASAGSRRLEGVPQVLILLSGARSVDSVDAPASALKQLGVLTFAIGTRNADKREMQKIAHEPTHAVSVSEFNDLPNVQQQLQSSVEAVIVEVTPETPTAPVDAPKKDIVFLLDGSDATRNGFPAMRDFVERVVEKLNVGENKDRVSVVQYSREPEVHFYLNTYNTRADIVDTVRGLRHRGGRTLNTGAALQYVRDNVFTNSSGSRRLQGVPQMLILLNGGRSYDNVDAPASALKQQGIVVIGIGAGRADSAEMQKISSDPTYALSVSELTDLPSVHEQLSSVMSTVLVRATPITPTVTAERQPTGRDVVFLLDGSDGTRTEFPAVRDFVQRMVDTLSVDDSRDRVAVVQYSRDAAVQFYLNTYTTKAEILDTVRGLRHKGGRPLYTGAALQYVRDNVFTASAGSRRLEGVPQVLILLSGARSVDSVDAPASALKQLGVLTFAIGTRNADKREMQKIAHEPTHAVSVSEFNDLPNVQQQLQSSVEAVIVEVTPETPTAPVDAPKKDIVFLLDASDATRNGFPAMRDFVERVVEKLNVGENKDRVSVVQYSREPEVHFYLNTYNTRADIVDTVRGLRHRGGRTLNTGAALQYVRDNVFTNSSGSRRLQGVPQMLILLNGGRSYDNVDAPASALKQQGIVVIGIGAGRADSAEMQKISSDPTYALSVSELTDLPSVHEQLSSVMSTVLVRATPITPTVTAERQPTGRDVVFLLDGSDGTRTEFPAVRDFVQRMVDTLSVDDSRDRVAVVQYSRDAAVQFYLNTYTTKAEILDTVRGLRHKGGRPLYTGAALQYVRDNVFTASAGSRRLEGVPQVLILLSGARSVDSVDAPASALKQLGVLTFAIGTRNADKREMQKIAHEPTHAVSVSEFNDLPNVQQQLQSSVEAVIVEVTPETPTAPVDAPKKDIVFLLDGSDATRNGFPAMRDFVERVVEKLNVGENKDRVSVVQYSREPEVHFYLNTYNTRADIVDTVRGLRHRGGRTLNTGAALQYVRDNVFTNSSGSRRLQGVPQMLILLNGGRSYDNVDAPASALKQQGIVVIGIGAGRADSAEMQKISSDPTYALSVSELTDLPSVHEQLSSVMSTVLVRATPITPTVTAERQPTGRDVVFLLDGSDGTRTEFPAVRDFVQRMVDTLSVDDSRDRVAVVQYSRDAAVQFYLNTYTTKAEILDTVRGLRHKGGRPLYTGAALQYVRDNVFTASAGSRRLEGVPQVLILLSGARSVDSVDAPASALKQLGVLTFAIGTRNADKREMQKIAHEPTHAVSVSEFNDLPNVQQQLQSSVEAVIVEVTPETPTAPVDAPKKDIVFLLDGSDATRNGFPAMRDFVERVVEKLNVGENKDRVSVVQYSREPEVHFYLNTYNTRADIVDTVRGLRHRGGRTLNTGAALQYVRDNVFTNSSGSRRLQGVPQMLILLNGGRSYDNVDAPASALKQQGIVVIGIGAGRADSAEMQKISSDPTYALSVSELTDLPSVHEQLSSVMSTVLVRATPITPTVTAERQPTGRDVVFLLDGSDGTRTEFPAVRDFVQRMVDTLSVDDSRDRVAVVQYSRDAAVQFYLNTYTTKAEILDTVRGLRHKGGRPLYTGAALQYVRDNVFTASAGSRRLEGVPQVLILLSGARSVDSVDAPASALKQLGVLTFAIGTRNADKREMQKIAHEPTHAVSVSEFNDLPNVQQQLQSSVEAVIVEVTPETPTAPVDAPKKDIVFLLDGSDATRNGFPAMRDFVERVVEKLNVGENKDRVSVVQYSREPEVHFYLNTYNTRADIVDTVRGLRHRGGRTLNTGAALQYVRDNVFTNSSGSRRLQGVPQMLILLNGGRSYDNVDAPASALKQQGIVVIGIGAGRADSAEMQKISSDPTYALSVSELTDLPSVHEQLSSVMSTVLVRATPITPTVTAERQPTGRDVVFLLDGSDGTRTEFPAVRDFVQRMVDTLSVDDSRDRVAVVQYSRDAAVQFYLNTYTTKAEILDTVRGLRHKGGRPLYTGAALQYVRDNVFTASAGSRRLEGVPQVLILLSGARSVDSVDAPASALKQLGVLTFAIGTRNADKREMQKIAHEPTHAVSVSEFNDLPNVQQQLQSSVEAVIVEVTPETPTAPVDAPKKDIVFLLDGSDATRNGFPAMRDFVERVVEKLNVGENKDRVSVVQYSREPEVHFYLNTYNTRADIVDTVRGLRHRGGRTLNTGAALQYVRDNVFTNSSGSRRLQGVPQMLILLNGGRSYDNVDAPASALKQQGIVVIGIGAGRADSAEMQKISSDPTYALSVSELTDLPSVHEQLSSVMSTVLVRATPITPTVTAERQPTGRDVVFLLDGSDGTRTEFPAVRDFVQRMVDTLSVDDSRDRVAVVQYSRDAAVQFYLNTYTTKAEILDTVRGLRHKGGRPLYTGAALQYVRDNVFTASAGSRRLEGVPQVLILLSGARSVDSVDAPASALKQLGVLTFAIGTRNADKREMQKIAHEPTHAVSVSEFNDLPNVQQQLQSSVEAVIVEVTPETPTAPVDAPKKDIVFLLDGSDATRNGFPAMRDFVERVVEKLNVGENKDRVSVVQYSREPEVHFYLNTYNTRADIVDTVRGLRHRGGRTLNTGAALQYVRDNVFTNSSGSRRLQGVPQMLILLNGGRSYDNVDAPASALKQQGIVVIGIGAGRADSAEMQKISSDPTYALSVSELTDLPSVHEQLSSVMSTVLVRATPITPTVTAERQPTGRDVVFLLDGSDGTRTEFPAVRDFVQRMVDTLSVDDSRDRVAVVQYSRDAAVQFYLNTYTTKAEILDTVRGLRHKGGRPLYTGAALQYVRDNVFTASAGSRRLEGVPQVLILLSGARSVDSVDAPASALKQLGVLTFAIGTRNADKREMQKIAHEPTHAVSVSEFNDLPNVQQQLQSSVEAVIVEVTPETPTAPVDAPKKDIVFLLDGSDATRNGFPAMRDFVERVVEKLNVGENKDRVSVVQYSREPEVHFYLNTYNTRADIVDTVRGLRHRGGRTLNTGAALQYVRDNVFTNSSGSRRLQGVPQMLILLNGGRSYDNVDAPASALKQQGIVVIGIGAGRADSAEMQKISSDPTYALSVSELTDLPSVHEQLSSVMSTVLVRATPITPTVTAERQPTGRDVVFLLDGSDGTRTEFPAVRDFVQRMVDTLSVDDSRDRVAVVQYSRDAAVQFYLNTYTTKAEILDTVRGLRHKGGRPLYTGAALQYVRDNVFTASAGSRRLEGVPQVLILLSGARSVDSVDAPASALKQLGVLTFAIGTRNADKREMQKIAHEPTHAVSVSEFNDLPNVQQQLQSSVEAVIVEVTPETPTAPVDAPKKDIVFLLDGSDATRNGFPAMRDFVERVVEKLNVGENKDRVSVVQYSREPEVHSI
ncbi:LOW QUALITY PROTEIN: uncharacterized protein LOC115412071 [Sphaeramia orbicularis]|uniref:LOW QUALITY PROTEIN: uncharacterized protein LOC115412071 n=1 Tax=Sphaeramia orbicularis TaxID=375764 RepID=UPI00117E483C|nr:LOW QUALITY PROTEIN: uncharacterized protein LOC115412071 [Sphaeramia orbicularis]